MGFEYTPNGAPGGGGSGSVTSNELSAAVFAVSARSVGDVSTHGLQSVVNALSNRISAVIAGATSVTSAEVQVASAAATSVNNRVNSVNAFISGISVRTSVGGATSIHGLQSVIDALSNQASDIVTSLRQTSLDLDAKISTLSDKVVSISAQLTSIDAKASVISDRVTSISAQLASIDSKASVISDRVTSISAQLVSLETHASTASAAATSVNARVTSVLVFISGISSRSVGDVSTHGLQSVIDALSNRISGVTGGTGSVTSTEWSIAAYGVMNLQNVDATSMIPGHVIRPGTSANTMNLMTVVAGWIPTGINLTTLAVSATGPVMTHGLLSLTSVQMRSIFATGVSAVTPSSKIYAIANGQWATQATPNAFPIGQMIAERTLGVVLPGIFDYFVSVRTSVGGATSVKGMQSVADALSNQISDTVTSLRQTSADLETHVVAASAAATSVLNYVCAVSARTSTGGATSVKGLQSIVDALSNQVSDVLTSIRQTSADLDAKISTLSGIVQSASARTSTGGATSIKGIQSVIDALSNQVSDVLTSVRTVSSDVTASLRQTSLDLQTSLNTVSNLLSATISAYAAASTVGSIAALSLAILNDASVSAAIKTDILSVLSAAYGTGQVRNLTTGIQNINNTAMTKISGLSISLAANAYYLVQGRVEFTLSTVSGCAFGFVYPGTNNMSVGSYMKMDCLTTVMAAGPTGSIYTSAIWPVGIIQAANMSTAATLNISLTGVSGTMLALNIDGVVNTNSAGVIELNAKGSAATGAPFIQIGSHLRAYKLT